MHLFGIVRVVVLVSGLILVIWQIVSVRQIYKKKFYFFLNLGKISRKSKIVPNLDCRQSWPFRASLVWSTHLNTVLARRNASAEAFHHAPPKQPHYRSKKNCNFFNFLRPFKNCWKFFWILNTVVKKVNAKFWKLDRIGEFLKIHQIGTDLSQRSK